MEGGWKEGMVGEGGRENTSFYFIFCFLKLASRIVTIFVETENNFKTCSPFQKTENTVLTYTKLIPAVSRDVGFTMAKVIWKFLTFEASAIISSLSIDTIPVSLWQN